MTAETIHVLSESRRREYLKALDIDLYTLRTSPQAEAGAPFDAADVAAPDWEALEAQVSNCTRCALSRTRTRTVFGIGSRQADWMIVGEAPGQEEDRRGEPFVGRAGKLLDEMLLAVGMDRSSAFIANVLKCRPPNNRDPADDEADACRAYLDRQIELVSPKIILAVGRIAAQRLLQTDEPVGRLRGRTHFINSGELPVVVTYHPAYLLRSPTQKRKTWQDLVLARRTIAAST
ncbi:MAG: uracil-DNA glycosylase [Gammaproteobacteria bacterium]|nr:uracil-DNA glycosylase [Gammaproteobacteria bacterium]MDH5345796.1 uracil-DNA glycosylase [Gammaproteobacteria bacterium]